MNDKTLAVVGVSNNPQKYGFKIFRDLTARGYKVNGVNLKGGEVLGKKIYRNLGELVELPDLVITVVPPVITEKIVEDCHTIGVKEVWMQPGSESEKAIQKAEQYGIMATSRKCFMVSEGIW